MSGGEPIKLRQYQEDAKAAFWDAIATRNDNPCVVMPTGCHAIGHPILMYDGSIRNVEEVVIDDLVMGPDSLPRRVVRLCQGREEMFEIQPKRDEAFVVNGNHVLSLVTTNEGKRFACNTVSGTAESISVNDYLTKSKSWKHLRKLWRTAVDFPEANNLPIPPYFLGVWLGDGNENGVSKPDEEILVACEEQAASMGCVVRTRWHGDNNPSYRISSGVKSGKRNGKNPFTNALRSLSLFDATSGNKFIPREYLVSSREQRSQLLAGMLDTDGHMSHSGYDWISKSSRLADGFVFLARSLGFHTKRSLKWCVCQTGQGGWYHRVHLSGNCESIPCRIKRKMSPARKQKKNHLRSGFSIRSIGGGCFYGFELDSDHLYVDGYFRVHHNSGKSPTLAAICSDAVNLWNGRVLILAHVKELLEQSVDKLHRFGLTKHVGIYSAGLKQRDKDAQILVGGIQSVYSKSFELGKFDIILIDEAHLIPADGDGRYRTFLKDSLLVNPLVRIGGFTATPYRTDVGELCGPDNILNHICYEVGVDELMRDGYLCRVRSKRSRNQLDLSGLHTRAGEFVADEMEALFSADEVLGPAIDEILAIAGDRQSVLVFAAGVDHARKIMERLAAAGQSVRVVVGTTPSEERAETLAAFKRREFKYLVNVAVLTTGFDATCIDCVVILRATMSPGLFYQLCGRGFRLHESKADCLILDFGQNIMRHGPVDKIRARKKRKSDKESSPPVKFCPQCEEEIPLGVIVCPACGAELPREQKHAATASDKPIISSDEMTEVDWIPVESVSYLVHTKRNSEPGTPQTMRVIYSVGWQTDHSEWICVEHQGFARGKAAAWWRKRCTLRCPTSAEQAVYLADHGCLAVTTEIKVEKKTSDKFWRVTDARLGPIPDPPASVEERMPGLDLPEEPAEKTDGVDEWLVNAPLDLDDVPF